MGWWGTSRALSGWREEYRELVWSLQTPILQKPPFFGTSFRSHYPYWEPTISSREPIWHWGARLVGMVQMGWRLDYMILVFFSNFNYSMTLWKGFVPVMRKISHNLPPGCFCLVLPSRLSKENQSLSEGDIGKPQEGQKDLIFVALQRHNKRLFF